MTVTSERRNPLRLPPGMSLTDIWGNLTPIQKRAWLAVVSREARAVTLEVQQARARTRRPLDLTGLAAVVEREREAGQRRSQELGASVATWTVGHPRALGEIDLTPWRTDAESAWTDAELRAARRARRGGDQSPEVRVASNALMLIYKRMSRARKEAEHGGSATDIAD